MYALCGSVKDDDANASEIIGDLLRSELHHYIECEDWGRVERLFDRSPALSMTVDPSNGELPLHSVVRYESAESILIDKLIVMMPDALTRPDMAGMLPIHHAAAHAIVSTLEVLHEAYQKGTNEFDGNGRLPIHVAAEYHSVDAIGFFLRVAPDGAYALMQTPSTSKGKGGGGLPLHVACRNYKQGGTIDTLLAINPASAQKPDENGDFPLHLLLRCGSNVDSTAVKSLLREFPSALSAEDSNGDIPLISALKFGCRRKVVTTLLSGHKAGAHAQSGKGKSPLHLALTHDADDEAVIRIINIAPKAVQQLDPETKLLPIEIATARKRTTVVVHRLLMHDLPIDISSTHEARLVPHGYSWNHLVSRTSDDYCEVIAELLRHCSQHQVVALSAVEAGDGTKAVDAASPVSKRMIQAKMRLFNCIEIVNDDPAFVNPHSQTTLYYGLMHDDPFSTDSTSMGGREGQGKDRKLPTCKSGDDLPLQTPNNLQLTPNDSAESLLGMDRLLMSRIGNKEAKRVVIKFTASRNVVEREVEVRSKFHLSKDYVCSVASLHPSQLDVDSLRERGKPDYCVTLEAADTTLENMLIDQRQTSRLEVGPTDLKEIGACLGHIHDCGLVHGDFGAHNVGKFGDRWKILGVGGAFSKGEMTDPRRAIYCPPETIRIERQSKRCGKKKSARMSFNSIPAHATYDIFAFGVMVYEAVSGQSFPLYEGEPKIKSDVDIANWDIVSLQKKWSTALCRVDPITRGLLRGLLQPDPATRLSSMNDVLTHDFFLDNVRRADAGTNNVGSEDLPPIFFVEYHDGTCNQSSFSSLTGPRRKLGRS